MFLKRKTYTERTDEALMGMVGLRDERAFEALYERYGPRMYRFFLRMLWQNAAKAEDFTQELFVKIIEKPERFDTARNFKIWLYAVAANMCKNEYRRAEAAMLDMPEDTNLWSDPVQEQIDEVWLEAQLNRQIGLLSEQHRKCVVLRYQEGLSVAEIAEILDCPEGTVKSRLHNAVKQLKSCLTTTWL